MERRLFILQRLSAMVLAPLVLVHLGLILYAVRDGLTAAEILGRTQGSLGWALFYGAFVLAAAVHAPLGLRNILREWTGVGLRLINLLSLVFGLLLAGLGLRAVVAVVA
ncbi:succinate dehydrogenase [Pelagibius litoralis]|uniref:Succinate dehydrogenase n=2 Tax=Pelagibius litoralis TaxID=374515 RepID=A0A967EXN5_9PROT|nr:succinate dehydrogenase [Pelagibius litoralis]